MTNPRHVPAAGVNASVYHGAPMPAAALNPNARLTLIFLAALVALGPLSIDMYLPAMPAMQRDLDTDIAHMHLTLSAFLWGFALFHLACGPLADRYGRRPLLIAGITLYVLATGGCMLSQSVEELAVCRFIQGIGACVGPTLGRTITRDLFGPRDAARALSLIAMLMALAPAVAPGLGGIMLRYVAWPVVFVFLGAYGLVLLWMVFTRLPETLTRPQSLAPLAIAGNYLRLLRDPVFLPVALASALAYSGMMAYLACSGFVFIDMYGVPVESFGLIFLTTVIGYISGSAVSARLASRYLPIQVLLLGAALSLGSTLVLWLAHSLLPQSVLAIVIPLALYTAALGLILPNAMALSLEHFPEITATASALFGFLQMGLSAAITAAVGTLLEDSPLPMIWTLCAAASLSLLLVLLATRNVPQDAYSPTKKSEHSA